MSFFGGNGEEESFNLSEHDGFLNLPEGEFFNLLEDSKDKGDELSITNSVDKSPSNKHSPHEEDVNGMTLQETVDEFEVNSMRSNTNSRGESKSLESEVGSHFFMPVDTRPEEEMKGGQCPKVPNSIVQSSDAILPVMSPPKVKQHSRSAAKASSFSRISNTMVPSFIPPSSSPVSFLSAKNHSYNGDNRGTSSSTSTRSTRQRAKNGIDRIIEEHEKRVAEKAAIRKANSNLPGYSGIQKKTPVKKGHRYSGSLDESLGRCQIEPPYNRHHVPVSLSPQKECPVNVDGSQAHGFQGRGPFQQIDRMRQMQTIPPNLDHFEQFSHGKMCSYLKNYANSDTKQRAPFHRQLHASTYNRFELQKTPISTQTFQQLGQQMMDPFIGKFHNQSMNREREASVHPNEWPVSHNQSLQSRQSMDPQEQNYSFQQTGHKQNNSGFSHINYSSILEEPHSPLFPERNSWMPQTNTDLHGQAYDQWQTSGVQESQFGTQQHTNMSSGRSTNPFPSLPPSSFTSEQNSGQILEPLLDLPENTVLAHRPKK
ncbi:8403fb7b-fded-4708-803e-45e28f99321d [Sclerotinia trifoliorum]|uniref:8403fb7b-fded-4708-803e-45e28f99321d n=1 Tax=Sclerotinia trifoliorum TaxID=28548 RepID=A0A8H2VZJ3_9HELO|nr:8403fb7b-fded-4708-803e-45e28f99321d [Sclerotinia trifoliorum]